MTGFTILCAIALIWYITYLWACARAFPALALASREGWIPVLNDYRLFERAGVAPSLAASVIAPVIGFVIVWIVRSIALFRLTKELELSFREAAIGILLPQLWLLRAQQKLEQLQSGAELPFQPIPQFHLPQHASNTAQGFVPNRQTAQTAAFSPTPSLTASQHEVPHELTQREQAQYRNPGFTHANGFIAPQQAGSSQYTNSSQHAVSPQYAVSPQQSVPSQYAVPPQQALPPHHAVPPLQALPPQQHAVPPQHLSGPSYSSPSQPAGAFQTPVVSHNPNEEPQTNIPLSSFPYENSPKPLLHNAEQAKAFFAPPISQRDIAVSPAQHIDSLGGLKNIAPQSPEIPEEQDFMYGVFKKEPAPEQQPIALKSEDGTESRWMLDVVNGMSFPILSSEVTIGRISKKDPNPTPDPHHIRLADPTRTVSKTHARLVFRDVWYIEDLGSTNGVVLIDGVESETEVVPGELVIAGSRFLLGTLEVRLRRLP